MVTGNSTVFLKKMCTFHLFLNLKTAVNEGKDGQKKGPKGLKGHKGRTNQQIVLQSFRSFMS